MNPTVIDNRARILRKEADALVVVVVTADRVAYSIDERMSPQDVLNTLKGEAPNIARRWADQLQKQQARRRDETQRG